MARDRTIRQSVRQRLATKWAEQMVLGQALYECFILVSSGQVKQATSLFWSATCRPGVDEHLVVTKRYDARSLTPRFRRAGSPAARAGCPCHPTAVKYSYRAHLDTATSDFARGDGAPVSDVCNPQASWVAALLIRNAGAALVLGPLQSSGAREEEKGRGGSGGHLSFRYWFP